MIQDTGNVYHICEALVGCTRQGVFAVHHANSDIEYLCEEHVEYTDPHPDKEPENE
jgi:hypothetical protein